MKDGNILASINWIHLEEVLVVSLVLFGELLVGFIVFLSGKLLSGDTRGDTSLAHASKRTDTSSVSSDEQKQAIRLRSSLSIV
jgi:hypothetical protein